jgi:acetylxylan esterase
MTSKRATLSTPIFGTMLSLLAAPAWGAGDVQQISTFGSNPSGIGMYLYTPSNVSAKPAIVVNVHACHGKGTDVCGPSGAFAQQADKWGFLVICPSAVSADGCWDVHSTSVLTHDGGGDATGIISMVKWVVQNKNGDPDRVYVAGHSSGGMMTNVMLGSYPDVFKAGAAYAGVPFACYAQGAVDSLGWNSNCAQGKVILTAKEWGDLVRAAYPGFAGTRPRIQIWHGTKDDTVYFQNFKEEIKQWTNVFGLGETPSTTENNALQSTWIRTRYADGAGVVQVEAIEETGQPHNLVVDAAEAIHFFGLDLTAPKLDGGPKDAPVDVRTGTGGAGGSSGAGSGGSTGAGGQSGGSGGTRPGGAGGSAGGGFAGAGGNRDAGVTGGGGSGGSNQSGSGGSGGQTTVTSSGGRVVDAGVDRAVGSGGASGGSAGSGGAPSTGGQGGSAGAGGAFGTGGAGGSAGSGGTTKVGGNSGPTSHKSSGCSTAAGRPGRASQWLWLFVALVGTVWPTSRRHGRKGRRP